MNAFTTIDEYISNFPAEVQELLQKMRQTIHEAEPNGVETIAYGMPAFKLNDRPLAYFGAFKHHIGFYPTPEGLEAYAEEFKNYAGAKGSVQFPYDKPTPYDSVTKVVKYRSKKILELKK